MVFTVGVSQQILIVTVISLTACHVCAGATPVHGKFVVKLADFGLSRRVQVKQQAINVRKTVSGLRMQASVPIPAKGVMTPATSMQRVKRCVYGNTHLQGQDGKQRTHFHEVLPACVQSVMPVAVIQALGLLGSHS